MNNANLRMTFTIDNRKVHHKDMKRNRLKAHTHNLNVLTLLLPFDAQKTTDFLKANLLCSSMSWIPWNIDTFVESSR